MTDPNIPFEKKPPLDEWIREWARDMEQTDEGKTNLSNILHDCLKQCPSKAHLQRFFSKIAHKWGEESANPGAGAGTGIRVLQTVVNNVASADLCQGPLISNPPACS